MGDEFYCVLKLVSGEEIFSLICIDENDGDPVIVLQNPVTMKLYNNHTGSFIKIKPWMELSNEDFFIIKPDKVLTMTESSNKKIIDLYEDYLSNDNIDVYQNYEKNGRKVNLSNKMGYISSVEEARKKLENLFKDSKES